MFNIHFAAEDNVRRAAVSTLSKLTFVDLAGSELLSGEFGAQQQGETKNINLSLLALRGVMAALANSETFVPYRDSVLTRVLSQSLSPHGRTAVLVACSDEGTAVISSDNKPIPALETADATGRPVAERVHRHFGGNWSNVQPYKSNDVSRDHSLWRILFPSSTDDFVITFNFEQFGLDWIGIIMIPRGSLLGTIDDNQVSLGALTVFVALAIRVLSFAGQKVLQALLLPGFA